jgi:hypothetical protein
MATPDQYSFVRLIRLRIVKGEITVQNENTHKTTSAFRLLVEYDSNRCNQMNYVVLRFHRANPGLHGIVSYAEQILKSISTSE